MNDTLTNLISRMSPSAREILMNDVLPGRLSEAYSPFVQALFDIDYKRKPVSIRTFILDPQYLGRGIGDSIYPRIVDDLEELFEGQYSEVLLTGGIGWGKSRMAELGICYEIYRLSCLREPASVYGLMPGSTLGFLAVSVTEK